MDSLLLAIDISYRYPLRTCSAPNASHHPNNDNNDPNNIVNINDVSPRTPSPVRERQRLTEKERWTVIIMKEQGRSHTEIAEYLHIHINTVTHIIQRYNNTGKVRSGHRKVDQDVQQKQKIQL